MKVAITSQGTGLNQLMDDHFGQCRYVLLVQTDTMTVDAINNPFADESRGAGKRLADLISGCDIQTVLTGTIGTGTRQFLETARISVVTGCSGIVRDVVEAFKAGALSATAFVGAGNRRPSPSLPPSWDAEARSAAG